MSSKQQGVLQVQIPHFVRMISLVMADQLRTVVLNSINAFARLWDAFDLAADPHAASAGCPLEKQDGSTEVCSLLACWLCKPLASCVPPSYLSQVTFIAFSIFVYHQNARKTHTCHHCS